MGGAGFLAGFFLAVNTPVELRPELGVGEKIASLFHMLPTALLKR